MYFRLEEAGKKDEAKAKYEKSLTIKDDVRALNGLRNLERSPTIEVIFLDFGVKQRNRILLHRKLNFDNDYITSNHDFP